MSPVTRPIDGSFAHEVIGLRLWERQYESTLAALRALWSDVGLLVFRRQALTEDELAGFAAAFGRLQAPARADWASPGQADIGYISNLKHQDGRDIGGLGVGPLEWHTDQSYLAEPATGALLHAVEVPRAGGATHWANLDLAYRALPDALRRAVDGQSAVFSYARRMSSFGYARNLLGAGDDPAAVIAELRRRVPDVVHALTLVHPVSGRRALYLDPTTTAEVVGLTPDDGAALLRALAEHATRPEHVYAHHWQPGDLVLWNNAFLLHRRDDFDPSHPRLLKRATLHVAADRHFVPRGRAA